MILAWARFVDPNRSLEIFGVKLVAINAESGKKLLLSVMLAVTITLLSAAARWIARRVFRQAGPKIVFWVRQGIHIVSAVVLIVGVISIWFDEPSRLATAAGLVTAGIAFALQKVITALAGYVVILRGNAFSVGDRITLGGVRGDVVALGFIQTTIMEMGQAPGEQADSPSLWVKARQYTGRVVTVTNDKVFDTPVYNYTRDFPYIWEEMTLPISYKDDRQKVERLLADVALGHAVKIEQVGHDDLSEMERRFGVKRDDLHPRVYWRLTDNWLEITVRFITEAHGVREVKDAMSRDILRGLDAAGIGIASSTYDIVGMPPLRIVRERAGTRH